mgnify:CR=1 FL=1
MRQHITTANDGRDCWKTARERQRRKARFEIRERVSHGNTTKTKDAMPGIEKNQAVNEDLDKIVSHINAGDRAVFSLSFLAKNFQLLSTLVPTDFIMNQLPEQLIVSRSGSNRLRLLKNYLISLRAISLMEYSTLLDRYHILTGFISGGINPCLRGTPLHNNRPSEEDDLSTQQQLQKIGDQGLKMFFDRFPLSLSTYIVKRVVDMRLASFQQSQQKQPEIQIEQPCFVCGVCQMKIPYKYQLVYTDPKEEAASCHHAFCELCFWKDIIKNVGSRWGDVVLCPYCCCNQSSESREKMEKEIFLSSDNMAPQERSRLSKEKFDSLPVDTNALKKSSTRRKRKVRESEALVNNWSEAVLPSLGMCQSVRQDKFVSHTEACSIAYVRGCLDAGVEVNFINEYGQTALYVAAWRGQLNLVKLLLHYGADPRIGANGGLTIEGLCNAHGYTEILRIVHEYSEKYWAETESNGGLDSSADNINIAFYGKHLEESILDNANESRIRLETIIDLKMDHPGAGSYVIFDCIHHMDALLSLGRNLPIDQLSAKTQKKQGTCADRSYFCDAEGWIRTLLKKRIIESFTQADNNAIGLDDSAVVVLPHMRFLHYSQAGSSLAPHVDLNRADSLSGLRSTHSFLLYLSDCLNGGETVLLEELANPGVLAKVKPTKGLLLLFPHACPHKGEIVEDVPKLLIRGEVYLDLTKA